MWLAHSNRFLPNGGFPYEFLQDFTPGGQTLQLGGLQAEHPAQLALYSGTILLLTTCCGILVFRRKDLK